MADSGNHRIQKLLSSGAIAADWGSYGQLPGEFNYPRWVALDARGDIFVSDTFNHRVSRTRVTVSMNVSDANCRPAVAHAPAGRRRTILP